MATFRADASFAPQNKNGILGRVRRYLPVEFARQKQTKWMRRISSESLWGNPKIYSEQKRSADKMRDSAPLTRPFLFPGG